MRGALFILALLASAAVAQDRPIVESVFLRDSDMYAVYKGGDSKRLTTDGRRKRFLSVSPDGSRVAFLEDSPRQALGILVVLNADGTSLNARDFRPFHATGMSAIDELSWLGPDRLVVSGGLNPTTAEYAVVDARTGDELRTYFVDGSAWKPSPDGAHVAYLHYVPLTGAQLHLPVGREIGHRRFCVDEECRFDGTGGFPPAGRRLDFEWPPVWSEDGRCVAIVAADLDRTPKRVVLMRQVGGEFRELIAPGDPGERVGLGWAGAELRARSGELLWKLDGGTFVRVRN